MKNIRFSKKKYKTKVLDKSLYKAWLKKYPEYKGISQQQFLRLAKQLLEKYIEKTVETSHGIKLRYFMGEISVQYTTFKALNMKKTLEAGEEVNNLNLATQRKTGKVVWETANARKLNKDIKFLAFGPSKKFTVAAHEQIKNNPGEFKNVRIKCRI